MSILSEYFDKVYCINLDSRPDRWEDAQKEFERVNFDEIVRYSGVNGADLKISNHLLSGENGILQTHINIIKECKENGLKNILIMEDDVYFSREIFKIKKYLDDVPDNWDMIYFGGNHLSGRPLEKVNERVVKLNYSFGLQCVAIKNTMFDKIISEVSNYEKQIDVYYAEWQDSINAYCFHPNIALQVTGFSDIQKKVVNYDYFFKNF
jgi:glycosyl transferase family 25